MKENIKKLCGLVGEKADALFVTSPVNRRYITGFSSSDGFVIVKGEKITYITDFRYYESALIKQRQGKIDEEIDIQLTTGKTLLQLKQILNDSKKVLFEDRSLSYERYLAYSKAFDFCEFSEGGSDVLGKCRESKTQQELENIVKAQQITDKTYQYILGFISDNLGKKDFTEKALQLEMDYYMLKNGADGIAFDTIAVSGSKSSLPHGVPEDIPVAKGFLTMDFGAKYNGYCSDMTRTVCIGKPDDEMVKVYNTVLDAQKAALEIIHAGIVGNDADKAARDVIENAGYKGAFGHSLGHSLGLEIHERPNFAPSEAREIPQGAVVSVEPGIYLEGKYGVRIEDIVCLKDGGCDNLTHSCKKMVVL